MERDEDEVELLAARVKKAIHQSNELIRQSKVLEVQTAVFLNQLKTEREFANYPIVHAQPDFGSILSPLKWVVKAALQITEGAGWKIGVLSRRWSPPCHPRDRVLSALDLLASHLSECLDTTDYSLI